MHDFYTFSTSRYERTGETIAPQWIIQMMDSAHKPRVQFANNRTLWAMAGADPILVRAGLTNLEGLFSEYESISWERTLERGYRICVQNSLGFVVFLSSRYGIEADVVGLDGHLVLEAKGLLLDPLGQGLIIPLNLEGAEEVGKRDQSIV